MIPEWPEVLVRFEEVDKDTGDFADTIIMHCASSFIDKEGNKQYLRDTVEATYFKEEEWISSDDLGARVARMFFEFKDFVND